MGLFSLIFGAKRRVRIGIGVSDEFLPAGAVEFDATLSESHTAGNEITKHPVEVGSDITDHIRRQPEKLTLQGIVSNTPLVFLASLTESPTRAEEAYEKLKEIKDNGQLISVVTTLRQYDNMALVNMSVVRDVQNGNVLNATLELEEILTAETLEETSLDTSDRGLQPTTDASAASSSSASGTAGAVPA